MKSNWIVHSIAIIILAGSILFPREANIFNHSILGKLIAILLILAYATMDRLYGLIVCLLLILYYQETAHQMTTSESIQRIHQYGTEGFDSYSPNTVNANATPKLSTNYITPIETTMQNEYAKVNAPFREKYCLLGKLKHKGYDISKENAAFVFPELKFSDNEICDPCVASCKYTVSELLETETKMIPKSSKDPILPKIHESLENAVNGVSSMISDVYSNYAN
jgi:hypothetical protein